MGYTEYFLTSTYRDWGNFSVEHLVVLVGLLCFILVLYSIIRTKRTSAFKKARYAIFESKPILNKQDLPRKVYSTIVNQIRKEIEITRSIVPESPGDGDQGWKDKVHFNTSIANSYLVLDEAVILACPGLRLRNFKTVRDYFKALQKEFPEITQDIIEQYVCMYEEARFGNRKFTEKEYNTFMNVVLEIMKKIQ